MTYPYPPHLSDFPYVGRCSYALEFTTFDRRELFKDPETVRLTLEQFLRAGRENGFALAAYCFMPDHVHLVVDGRQDDADCKAYIKALKQYSNYYFKQARRETLLQRYGYERVIRTDVERALTIAYVVANPVVAGLVARAADYPFLGSEIYSIEDLLAIAESATAL
jgi:putative transposase